MCAPRSRRLIRVAIFSSIATLLIASSYISSYFGMWWLTGRGTISLSANSRLQESIYRPILHYTTSAGTGSQSVNKLSMRLQLRGAGITIEWDSIDGTIHPNHGRRTANAP